MMTDFELNDSDWLRARVEQAADGVRAQFEQAAADLDAAADVIDEKGWCRNKLKDEQGRMCAQGAVLVAIRGVSQPPVLVTVKDRLRMDAAMDELKRYLALDVDGVQRHVSVRYWNDLLAHTQEEVTDALRRAAKDVRERVQQ
jgi:translation elongation factor EF-Ts